jgi:hypothetical protein
VPALGRRAGDVALCRFRPGKFYGKDAWRGAAGAGAPSEARLRDGDVLAHDARERRNVFQSDAHVNIHGFALEVADRALLLGREELGVSLRRRNLSVPAFGGVLGKSRTHPPCTPVADGRPCPIGGAHPERRVSCSARRESMRRGKDPKLSGSASLCAGRRVFLLDRVRAQPEYEASAAAAARG